MSNKSIGFPPYDRVLVKRLAAEEKSAGGLLYIPETVKEKPAKGIVVSVGQGRMMDSGKFLPLAVKTGDTVLFGKYAGTEINLEGEDHIVIREEEILMIFPAAA